MKGEHIVSIIAVLAILIMGGVLILSVLYPNGILPNTSSMLTISATGNAGATPQQGTISLYVNSTGITSAIATSNLSVELLQVNNTLLKYTNTSSISTQYYSLWKEPNSSIYVASEYMSVQLPNVNNLTPALQNLSLYKNVFVSDVSAQLSDAQANELSNIALQQAVRNATAQAEALTNNATLTVKNITVNNYRSIFPYALSGAVNSGSGYAPAPLFFNGRESITEAVQITFAYTT